MHRLPHTTYIAAAATADKTTTTTIPLWTANDDSGGKAIIIIDDPSPRDTLRSPSTPPPCHRLYLPASPYLSRRRRGCDYGKTVSIFSSPGPADWNDGKFPNEFIAFLRSVPCTVRGNLLYFILSKKWYLFTTPHSRTTPPPVVLLLSLPQFPKTSLSSSRPQLPSHGKAESDDIRYIHES